MKAKCRRLRGRSHVILSSVFKFDDEGICEVDLNKDPQAYKAWPLLLEMNGVKEIVDEVEKMPVVYTRKELGLPALSSSVNPEPKTVEVLTIDDPVPVVNLKPEVASKPEKKEKSTPKKKKTARRKSKKKGDS